MPRVTFGDVKASRIPEALNIYPNDSRLAQFVNEAQQILLHRMHPFGSMARYLISSSDAQITLPREIASVEKAALNRSPLPVHDFWYEWIENGWGPHDLANNPADGRPEAAFVGRFPTFSDIVGVNKQLRLVCDLASDVGKSVLVLGYDANGNWIRTTQGGVILDGEVIVLAQTPGTNSTTLFSKVTDIQPPADLDGQWWMYEYDTTLLTQRLIGQYQYNDLRPNFARWLFPQILTPTTPDTVYIWAKLDLIPVVRDTDYLIIGNLTALKKGCLAVLAQERHDWTEAEYLIEGRIADKSGKRIGGAVQDLEAELAHYLGDGPISGITVQGSSVGENQCIPELV